MERIKIRYKAAYDSLERFKEDLDILIDKKDPFHIKYYRQIRNSSIQSFEFSIDTFWKLIKDVLDHKYGIVIEMPTPRGIFKQASLAKLITKNELNATNKMVADRNLTSHTYNEDLAEDIASHLPEYCYSMQKIMKRIDLKIKKKN
jgi:nucleotidyltransferase substrate binding protein (TIGR01987 family)